ncbi:MAG: OmpA family protein [Deltaproteobacteria bacterium]|nr:OmpA family protein [Deltaproteobacteria bacterium]
MAQSLYDPAIDTKGHITMDGSPVLPHLRFSLGLLLDFGFNSWFAVEQDKVQIEEGIPIADSMELTIDGYNHIMMERMIAARFQANFGLFNRLAIGFQIPIMVPTGQLYKYDAEGFEEHDHWSTNGFGDISLHIKGALLRSDWHPIGIAFIAQYFLPTGKSEYLTGEPGGGAFAFKAILDAEPFSWYRIGFNAGIRLPLGAKSNNYLSWDRENNDNNEHQNQCTGDCVDNEPRNLFKYGSSFYFGVGQSFRIFPEIMDLVLELYGNQLLSEAGNSNYLSMEGTVGLKFFIEESSFLMAGYAHGLPTADNQSGYGYQSMEHRAFLGFCYEPSMDILIREEDMDRDGDGIPDKNDACPDDPEDLNGIDDEDGCPENDMDGDGIKDQVDKCPLVPEDKDGDRDDDGCPESNEYVGAATASQTSDRDMDRIVDINDKCPDEPETYNGRDDEDGCPDEGDVIVTSGEIQILKKIYFEYNSAKIKPISFQILNEVAATIVNNPQIDKIEIQGHADERGKDSYNLKLTKRRAKSVRDYLTKKGVPPGKLQSQGYGEYCPINSASNEQAWEENRRVEFKVVALNGSSTGIKLGCALADQKGIK